MAETEIKLVILGPEWDVPTVSPFGYKLATWMKVADIPHTLGFENDPRKGPKGKSPWIEVDGTSMGDSELIIERLAKEHGDPDAHLTKAQQATSLAIRRLLEDHYNFALMHAMFITDAGWAHMKPHFDFIPALVRPIVVPMIRRDVRHELFKQGIGRHAQATIDAMAIADLNALDALLGDQPFFFGERPTLADCSAFGFLAITLWSPIAETYRSHLQSLPGLVAFCERMQAAFWADAPAAVAA